jgi:hypothetical protein
MAGVSQRIGGLVISRRADRPVRGSIRLLPRVFGEFSDDFWSCQRAAGCPTRLPDYPESRDGLDTPVFAELLLDSHGRGQRAATNLPPGPTRAES